MRGFPVPGAPPLTELLEGPGVRLSGLTGLTGTVIVRIAQGDAAVHLRIEDGAAFDPAGGIVYGFENELALRHRWIDTEAGSSAMQPVDRPRRMPACPEDSHLVAREEARPAGFASTADHAALVHPHPEIGREEHRGDFAHQFLSGQAHPGINNFVLDPTVQPRRMSAPPHYLPHDPRMPVIPLDGRRPADAIVEMQVDPERLHEIVKPLFRRWLAGRISR